MVKIGVAGAYGAFGIKHLDALANISLISSSMTRSVTGFLSEEAMQKAVAKSFASNTAADSTCTQKRSKAWKSGG